MSSRMKFYYLSILLPLLFFFVLFLEQWFAVTPLLGFWGWLLPSKVGESHPSILDLSRSRPASWFSDEIPHPLRGRKR